MAKEVNTRLELGKDHAFAFTILNDTETAAVDITTWQLSFMVKRRLSDLDANALITKTTPSGILVDGDFDPSPIVNTQVATVSIADTDTANLAPGLAYYELERSDSNAETPLASGTIELFRGVHR